MQEYSCQSWVQCMHSFTPPWTKQNYKGNTLPYKIASKAFPHPWNTLHAVEGMEMGRISTLAALFIIGIIFETTPGNQHILFIHFNIPCLHVVFAQQNDMRSCLQSTTSDEPIPFEDLSGDGDPDRIPTERQVIVASYQFQCCGNITRWQTFVEPGGGREDGEYTIIFQVWRPGLGVELDGCYSLIGQDIYADIELGRDGLVDRTLGPKGFLPVQPGDVVGYSMSRVGRTGERDGIQLEPRGEDEGEEMWYQSDADPLTTGSGSCLFSVGIEEGRTLRSFTNSAPILSVDIGKGEIANSTILYLLVILSRGWPYSIA